MLEEVLAGHCKPGELPPDTKEGELKSCTALGAISAVAINAPPQRTIRIASESVRLFFVNGLVGNICLHTIFYDRILLYVNIKNIIKQLKWCWLGNWFALDCITSC